MLRASSLALSLLFLSGCNDAGTEAASREQGQPVPVEALVIAPRAQMLTTDLPGRIAPIRVAEVRARVAGIVQKRHFTEGAVVKEGDLLFTVEPAPLQAALGAIAARWPLHRPGSSRPNPRCTATNHW